ncbi:MAG: branched-chain amino acid ABC transporter substrate-binding protein [Phycisphaerales bacterium]|jgi:branched-chain amino acid transport system substrate-binding protein
MLRKTASALAACAISALLIAAAPSAPAATGSAAPPHLTIVSSLPRTGSANSQTTSIVNGIKMAIEERSGKIGEFEIRYEDMDDASPQKGNWDQNIEAANANKAAKDPTCVGYIGTYNSGAAKIAMPILNKAGLVMVSPGNTYPGLTKPGAGEANEPKIYRPSGTISYFRVVPTDDIQGAVACEFCAKDLGSKKAFILHDRELYGKGIADVFKKSAPGMGIEVAGFEGIDPKASNYRSLVTKIRSTGADVVFYGGTTQTNAAQILKDLRSGGCKVPFVTPDGTFENAYIEAAGKDAMAPESGSVYITFGGLPSEQLTGRGAEFVERYKKKHGEVPEAYAVYGYEACKVLLDAIDRAATKNDRAAVLAAVAATKDFQGALGTWSFDANGDTTNRLMSINTVKDGKFAFVKAAGGGTGQAK